MIVGCRSWILDEMAAIPPFVKPGVRRHASCHTIIVKAVPVDRGDRVVATEPATRAAEPPAVLVTAGHGTVAERP